jgi:uncharacterized membrane protein YqiK
MVAVKVLKKSIAKSIAKRGLTLSGARKKARTIASVSTARNRGLLPYRKKVRVSVPRMLSREHGPVHDSGVMLASASQLRADSARRERNFEHALVQAAMQAEEQRDFALFRQRQLEYRARQRRIHQDRIRFHQPDPEFEAALLAAVIDVERRHGIAQRRAKRVLPSTITQRRNLRRRISVDRHTMTASRTDRRPASSNTASRVASSVHSSSSSSSAPRQVGEN